MPTWLPSFDIRIAYFLLVILFTAQVHGVGVQFTSPAGGGTWPAGPITIAWEDGGGSPDMADLTSYTLQLIVGGDTNSTSAIVAQLASGAVSVGQVQAIISPEVAQSIQNGFFLMMTSAVNNGNQVINYSNRFTLISMNGSTPATYVAAANAAKGIADVPAAQYNVLSPPAVSTSTYPATSTVTSTSTATAQTAQNSPPHGGRSPGDLIIGLSIGLLFAVSLIVAIGIWALVRWRRKRRRDVDEIDLVDRRAYVGDKAELPAVTPASPTTPVVAEMGTPQQERLGRGSSTIVEMADRVSIRYELEGDWTGWEAGSGRHSQAYDPTR